MATHYTTDPVQRTGLRPTIIPRDQHCISRKQISPNALRVLYRLKEAGFGAYLVGGAVRDLLLGGSPKDFDVATDATPDQVRGLFRNCRLIGRRFRLAHVMYGSEVIEVATFRANVDDGSGDRELEDGRLVRDNVYGSIEDDAIRRDFTVNAMYYAIEDFSVRDYVDGFADLEARRMRLIGDPDERYREDPVRMLRAVRLAAKLGFEIEASTAEPIPRLAGLLAQAPPARLFDEALKLFLGGHGEAAFLRLEQHGLLSSLLPETCAVLEGAAGEASRQLILQALANTDLRVRENRPVTPAFLFAALLWPAYQHEVVRLESQGLDPAVAHQRAADRVTLHQIERIALPRRFSTPMHEIWALQPRFAQRQRKRVFRLMSHPRFRAAFDFLELRVIEEPALEAEASFWREAQTLPPDKLSERLQPGKGRSTSDTSPAAAGAATSADKPKRRRRRRRGGKGAGTVESGSDTAE